MFAPDIIDRLKVALGAASDRDLANRLGIPQRTLSNWRNRESIPFQRLTRLAEQVGRSVAWLLTGRDSKDVDVALEADVTYERMRREKARDVLARLMDAANVQTVGDLARRLEVTPQRIAAAVRDGSPMRPWIRQIADAAGVRPGWIEDGVEPRGAMVVAEPQAPYKAEPDLSKEEKEFVQMLLAILRGRNRENVEAIKSNIKAFYKSREMDSEPMLPTQHKAAG